MVTDCTLHTVNCLVRGRKALMSLAVTLHSHGSTGYNSPLTTLYRNRDLSFPPPRKDPTTGTGTGSFNTLCRYHTKTHWDQCFVFTFLSRLDSSMLWFRMMVHSAPVRFYMLHLRMWIFWFRNVTRYSSPDPREARVGGGGIHSWNDVRRFATSSMNECVKS